MTEIMNSGTACKDDFSEEELFLFTTAMSAFYDEGI